jgi:hypothetical protein
LREGGVAIIETNFRAVQFFDFAGSGAIEIDFTNVRPDLSAVGASIHAQRAAHASGHADQSLHAALVVLGAKRDGTTEIGCGIDVSKITLHAHAGFGGGQMKSDPGEFAIADQNIRAAAQKTPGNALVRQQRHHFSDPVVSMHDQLVRGTANCERSSRRERDTMLNLDAEVFQFAHKLIANAHA